MRSRGACRRLSLGLLGWVAFASLTGGCQPLPFKEVRSLVLVREEPADGGGRAGLLSGTELAKLRRLDRLFTSVEAFQEIVARIARVEDGMQVLALHASPGLFEMLGVEPLLGRASPLGSSDDLPALVVGHDLWEGWLGGDPRVLGRPLSLNGEPHTLIGVLPSGALPRATRLAVPLEPEAESHGPGLRLVARLHPGISLREARRTLEERLGLTLERVTPANW